MRRVLETVALIALGLALARLALLVADNRYYAWTPGLLEGWAPRPQVYRQLAPAILRAIMAATGQPWEWAGLQLLRASCIAWLFALRALAESISPRPGFATRAALLAPLFILPFTVGLYVYDWPSLALFTVCLWRLGRADWRGFTALFPLAVLAHDTGLVLIAVFVVRAWPITPRRQLAGLVALQLAAALAIKILLAARYAGNPGGLFQTNWIMHYLYLKHYAAGYIVALAGLAGLLLAALQVWRSIPPMLQAAAVTIPAFFAAYFLVGFPLELRAVIEVYPALYLLAFWLADQAARAAGAKLPIGKTLAAVVS